MPDEAHAREADRAYAFDIAAAGLYLANHLCRTESSNDRKKKMRAVVTKKRDLLIEAFPERASGMDLARGALKRIETDWERQAALRFVVDLSFMNPFAPYELKYKDADTRDALVRIAEHVGLTSKDVDRVEETRKDATKAHRQIDWAKIAVWGVGGTAVLAVGGWFLAPVIGGMIGAGAGLAGAAATAHGLAILGGGSLAIGGSGMAGGMWLVAGGAAAVGGVAGGGGQLLYNLGAASTRLELVKLQTSYKLTVVDEQLQLAKAQEVINQLDQRQKDVQAQLEEERELNEKNASRVEELEEKLKALQDGLAWMREQADGKS